MSPYAPAANPPKRLPLGSIARTDCPHTGSLVRVLHYEGTEVCVRSLRQAISYTTPAARLWAV